MTKSFLRYLNRYDPCIDTYVINNLSLQMKKIRVGEIHIALKAVDVYRVKGVSHVCACRAEQERTVNSVSIHICVSLCLAGKTRKDCDVLSILVCVSLCLTGRTGKVCDVCKYSHVCKFVLDGQNRKGL